MWRGAWPSRGMTMLIYSVNSWWCTEKQWESECIFFCTVEDSTLLCIASELCDSVSTRSTLPTRQRNLLLLLNSYWPSHIPDINALGLSKMRCCHQIPFLAGACSGSETNPLRSIKDVVHLLSCMCPYIFTGISATRSKPHWSVFQEKKSVLTNIARHASIHLSRLVRIWVKN